MTKSNTISMAWPHLQFKNEQIKQKINLTCLSNFAVLAYKQREQKA